jgi:predicted nucleic acid-binding protein
VSAEVWTGQGPVLPDTSAWIVARRHAGARALLLSAIERGDVAWCWPVRYELTIDARDADAIEAVDRTLEALREIRVDWSIQQQVLATMRELARRGPHGAHRLPLADLAVAVAARSSGLDLLHFDHHFDRLAELLGIRAWWLADPAG